MPPVPTRRATILGGAALAIASPALSQTAEIWSARQAWNALQDDRIRMIDVRSRAEWADSGVAAMTWPISMHERGFPERLMAARQAAGGRPVALICATGGRTASLMRALRKGRYDGFIDVSEGMMGSPRGKGWIAEGLPVVTRDEALAALPRSLG